MSLLRSRRPFSETRLVQALEYWQRKRGNRSMPSRTDIDPSEIQDLLPNVVLVDVLHDPLDFRIRLDGTAVVEQQRGDYTGQLFSTLWPNVSESRMWHDYTTVVRTRRPLYTGIPYAGPDEEVRSVRHVLLPLSNSGSSVDVIFGLVEFERSPAAEALWGSTRAGSDQPG